MMQFFTNLFGPAFGPTVAYLSLLLIVVAIALIAWFSYRSMNRTRLGAGNRNRQTRLAITDVALVDKHRRLVLLRRDEVEHLIMIGGHSDLVIESDIRRNAPARPRAAPENKPAAVPPMQKRPEQVAKQLPNEPMASPVAANGSNSKPAAAIPPLKLQEEAPKPVPKDEKVVSLQSTANPLASTASKVGATAGTLSASATAVTSQVAEAAKSAKSNLTMPVEATSSDHVKTNGETRETPKIAENAEPDQSTVSEMDALLEELAVPKK